MVLMVFVGFAELFTIGAVIPFLGVMTAPEDVLGSERLRPILEQFSVETRPELLLAVTALFCGCVVVSAGARMLLLWVQTKLIYRIGAEVSSTLYSRALYQPLQTHIAGNTSEFISSISNKCNELIVSFLYPMGLIVGAFVMLSIVSVGIFLVEPLLSVISILILGAVYTVIGGVMKRSLNAHGSEVADLYATQVRVAQEGLGGIRDVLLNGSQHIFEARFRTVEHQLRSALSSIQVSRGMPRFIVECFGMLFIAVLAWSYAPGEGGLEDVIPILGVVAIAAQRLVPVVQQLFSNWAAIVGGYASVSYALSLAEMPIPEIWLGPEQETMSFKQEVRLTGAGFYHEPDRWVFRNIDLTLKAGDRVGIVGTTGSGKSTLIDILMGLLPLQEGGMYVDGTLITDQNLRAWQRNIAHVPQDIFLTDTTIADNIAFGLRTEEIDADRVRSSASRAHLAQIIADWPDGYDTCVGERGSRLSGGQKQRVGIARALYKNASFVVLDEATSALDTRTEDQIMRTIEALPPKTTVLMVAHRTSTLRDCNVILRLDKGQLETLDGYDALNERLKDSSS